MLMHNCITKTIIPSSNKELRTEEQENKRRISCSNTQNVPYPRTHGSDPQNFTSQSHTQAKRLTLLSCIIKLLCLNQSFGFNFFPSSSTL